MSEANSYMKLSELSKITGISIPRIRYYVGKGVISKPIKVGKTRAFYTQEHVKKLELIKMLGNNRKIISKLSEIIGSVSESADNKEKERLDEPQIVRRRIIHASIPVFRQYGYEGATIGEVAKTAHISRNTIYKYFKDKKDLFIGCLNETILEYRESLPEDVKTLPDTKDTEIVRERLTKLGQAFLKAYPAWSDMMNLLRAAAVKEPRSFASKLEEAYNTRVKPLREDFGKLTRQKVFRNIDPDLAAAMIAGAHEYVTYFILRGKFAKDTAQIRNDFIDIILYGLLSKF